MRSVPFAYLLSLLVINGAAYVLAYRDRSFLAFGIALIGGPVLNAIMALCGGIVAWKERGQPGVMPVATAILLPVAFLVILEVAVFRTGFHGC